MRHRDSIILGLVSFCTLAITGVFLWSGHVRVGLLLLLLMVSLEIGCVLVLWIYQQRQRGRLSALRELLKGEIEALRVVRARQQRERERQQLLRQEQERIEALANHYLGQLASNPAFSSVTLFNMPLPLDVRDIYIEQRLSPCTYLRELRAFTPPAEEIADPTTLFLLSQQEIMQRSDPACEPEYALDRFRHCLLLGAPGSGKTTLLKYLTLKAASRQLKRLAVLPIYIDLRAFASGQEEALLDFAARQWDHAGFPQKDAQAYLREKLLAGQVLFLLDALDESLLDERAGAASGFVQDSLAAINHLAASYPQALIIVTSQRECFRQRLLDGFTELELLTFRTHDIEQFLTKWFTCHPDYRAEDVHDVLKQLQQSAPLRTLAAHPLFLTLLALMYRVHGDALPVRRAEIYQWCSNLLLERREREGPPRFVHTLRAEQKRLLLGTVAWHFHRQRKRSFPFEELCEVVTRHLVTFSQTSEKSPAVLGEMLLDTGLLKEQSPGWYGFVHLTLQEYFAAQAAGQAQAEGCRELTAHINDPWWEKVILFYVSGDGDALALLNELTSPYNSYLSFEQQEPLLLSDLLLAGKCLIASPQAGTPALRSSLNARLLKHLRRTHFFLVRQELAQTLVGQGDPLVDTALLDLLRGVDVPVEVQVCVVEALGHLASAATLEEDLLPLLFSELVEDETRLSITQVVAERRVQSAFSPLLAGLANRWMSRRVRLGMAQALGALIDDVWRAGEVLPLLSQKKLALEMRCALADSLGRSGLPDLVVALSALSLEEVQGSQLYWHLAIALAALGKPETFMSLSGWLSLPAGSAREANLSLTLKMGVLQTMGALRLPVLSQWMLSLLANEQVHWEVRIYIAGALEALGDHSIISELLGLVESREINICVRTAITRIIGSLGDARALRVLQQIPLQSQDEDTRRFYRCLLAVRGRLGEQTHIDTLLTWLDLEKDVVPTSGLSGPLFDPPGGYYEISLAESLLLLETLRHLCTRKALHEEYRRRLFSLLYKLAGTRQRCKELRRQVLLILPLTIDLATEQALVEPLLSALLTDDDVLDEAQRALVMMRRCWPTHPAGTLVL